MHIISQYTKEIAYSFITLAIAYLFHRVVQYCTNNTKPKAKDAENKQDGQFDQSTLLLEQRAVNIDALKKPYNDPTCSFSISITKTKTYESLIQELDNLLLSEYNYSNGDALKKQCKSISNEILDVIKNPNISEEWFKSLTEKIEKIRKINRVDNTKIIQLLRTCLDQENNDELFKNLLSVDTTNLVLRDVITDMHSAIKDFNTLKDASNILTGTILKLEKINRANNIITTLFLSFLAERRINELFENLLNFDQTTLISRDTITEIMHSIDEIQYHQFKTPNLRLTASWSVTTYVNLDLLVSFKSLVELIDRNTVIDPKTKSLLQNKIVELMHYFKVNYPIPEDFKDHVYNLQETRDSLVQQISEFLQRNYFITLAK